MTLASSGQMSIGGTTTNRSINVELGRSATATSSLGETDLRTLAGVSSGAISITNFYGKTHSSSLWETTLTIGTSVFYGQTYRGVGTTGSGPYGSASDTSCDLYSNTPTVSFYDINNSNTFFLIHDTSGTPTGNAGWTTLTMTKTTSAGSSSTSSVNRTNLTYSSPAAGVRIWDLGSRFTGPANGSIYSTVALDFT
tara:strand:+ start:195 stop:782 length:588 start_codon:yes stop_codon:yes gene_type:complete